MSGKIIDITEIETNSITATSSKLVVNFKKEVFFFSIFFTLFFIVVMILFLMLNKYFSFLFIFIFSIVHFVDKFGWFFPRNIPYLCIDLIGIGYKKRQIRWLEISSIKYQIVQPNSNLSGDYLCINLKNNKTISIDVNSGAIDSSIEIIAAYIKKYWNMH